MLKKLKKKEKFIGIIALVLAVVLGVVLLQVSSVQANKVVNVVAVRQDLQKGQKITDKDVELAEVGAYGLPAETLQDTKDVVGKYAAVEMKKGDYVFQKKLSKSEQGNDSQFAQLASGQMAVSFTVPSMASGLSNKLQKGDIIRLYAVQDEKVSSFKELQYVSVLSVSDSAGAEVADNTTTYTTVTVAVDAAQAEKIMALENAGTLYVTFITRESGTAQELLEKQAAYLRGEGN